ncbi:hypothetical protein [Bacillus sp. BB56-3]|nr:hypothetical protein [Bacillus sp. BB56-3]
MQRATLRQLYQIIRFEMCNVAIKLAAVKELERREEHARCGSMGYM